MSRAEWIGVNYVDDAFKSLLLDALLLKNDELSSSLFGTPFSSKDVKLKQTLRRRIAYWPQALEEITTDHYLKAQEKLTGYSRNKVPQEVRLALDHLMIGDDLPDDLKRMLYSLFMNAPDLLIIDNALVHYDDAITGKVLKYVSQYAKRTGLSILHLTKSQEPLNYFKGRSFELQNKHLVELVNH